MAELGTASGRLDDRVALITGAGSGIGRAMAEEFAARGALVAACDIDAEGVEATREAAQAAGAPRALALTADVARPGDVARAVSATQDELGRIDVLCSNAGILDGYASALDTEEALWDRVMDVNLKATWLVSRAVLPGMLERGSGAIIVTASVAGMVQGLRVHPRDSQRDVGAAARDRQARGAAGVRRRAVHARGLRRRRRRLDDQVAPAQSMRWPPSTLSVCPVIQAAASEARNTMACAMSRG